MGRYVCFQDTKRKEIEEAFLAMKVASEAELEQERAAHADAIRTIKVGQIVLFQLMGLWAKPGCLVGRVASRIPRGGESLTTWGQ